MSSIATPPFNVLRLSTRRTKNGYNLSGGFASPDLSRTSLRASYGRNNECSVESHAASLRYPRLWDSRGSSDLRFDKLQPFGRVFGRFIAREAVLDEEYWTAAWLRAEGHWENQAGDRHIQFHKRKFADQEFDAIKRRCRRKFAEDSTCIIAVKKEEKGVMRTVIGSIVGTLDFSIKRLLCGQSFPGDRAKSPWSCGVFRANSPSYGFVANLCVSKHARRRGVASNMLLLALDAALSCGVDQVFVNVDQNNVAAQKLYQKIGFQIFEKANTEIMQERIFLLCCKV